MEKSRLGTFANPYWHRQKWKIYYSGHEWKHCQWYYQHDDVEDGDDRYGYCESVEECKAEIDERYPDSSAPRTQS
jgi:hypothetical protein